MALLSCAKVRIAFDGPPLLDGCSLSIEKGERVGFLGRNGEGKSTFLQILSRDLKPDAGEVVLESGARMARVDQQVPEGLAGSTLDVIRQGAHEGTTATHHAERLASILNIDPAQDFPSLSGGQQRRALLARALVGEPDVLLLDEPTNHLDLAHIEQLESILQRHKGAVLFITHDRAFLQRVATRIVELDRGRLTSWDCDYHTYLKRKEELLAAEEREWGQFDKELAKEEAWLRRGIKARRTRNEGRVRALQQLRRDRADRRERVGQAQFEVQEGGRTSAKVVQAKNVSFVYQASAEGSGDEPTGPVLKDFSSTLFRGDKVGIIGPNGSGKSTLLKLLIGVLEPTSGTIKHGTSLEVAYFDQHREELDPNATLAHAVGGGSDYVQVGNERRHIYGYLEDFLFSSETTRRPVWSLSGGERNRLLLAKLFTKPANVLVLDEPTNDLDTDTLELLEARLVAYQGTVLVVSHDRAFLDNLCTSTLVFEGNGTFKEYVGGYSDWQRVVSKRVSEEAAPARAIKKSESKPTSRSPATKKPKKLSYREREEWNALPARIESLEAELEQLQTRMIDPSFLRGGADEIRTASARLSALAEDIEAAFDRWAELDERA